MYRFPRLKNVFLLCLACLLIPGGAISALGAPAETAIPFPTKLYIGHAGHLSLEIPATWMPNTYGLYTGPGGAVWDAPVRGAGLTLNTACRQEADTGFYGSAPRVETVKVATRLACIIWPSDDQPEWASGTMAAVVRHPLPYQSLGDPVDFVAIGVDQDHLESIMATLNFDPHAITAKDYFTSVFNLIQVASIKRDALNWDQVRIDATAKLGTSGTLADAYPGIQYVLRQLLSAGDYHSFFQTPKEAAQFIESEAAGFGFALNGDVIILIFPGSPADRAGLHVGDTIEAIDGEIIWEEKFYTQEPKEALFKIRRLGRAAPFDVMIESEVFDTYLPPEGRRLENASYLELLGVTGNQKTMARYATDAQQVIAEIDQTPNCGWVLDLRRNLGGAYFPMVAGVGSILGEGYFWGNMTADGETSLVEYRDGRIYDNGVDYFGQFVAGPLYSLKQPLPPVAVLMGPSTYSSGEVALLAFVGRPHTRMFGENSGGLTTSNASIELFDGALIALAVSVMTDRAGTPYPNGVVPDDYVATDWENFGTDSDPVLQAAVEWLEVQASCNGGPIYPDRQPPRS
jgi:carboxyl-terminal processing protease